MNIKDLNDYCILYNKHIEIEKRNFETKIFWIVDNINSKNKFPM